VRGNIFEPLQFSVTQQKEDRDDILYAVYRRRARLLDCDRHGVLC
jgi:hypothetical protein